MKYLLYFILIIIISACSSAKRFTSENDPSPDNRKEILPPPQNGEKVKYQNKTTTFFDVGNDALEVTIGVASYYADKFHGRKTSNGENYNMYDLTAAHRTYPFNTILRVTNLANGKNVLVRVNDRGPFAENRMIDLSYAAAIKLDMIKSGLADVKIEVLKWGK